MTECEKSPDGKHHYKQSLRIPAVMDITGCYHCIHCNDHKDTWNDSWMEEKTYTTEELL